MSDEMRILLMGYLDGELDESGPWLDDPEDDGAEPDDRGAEE